MARTRRSLLAGRNQAPLTDREVLRASNVFLGLDDSVIVKHEATAHTSFRVGPAAPDGEIVFGPDVYPGPGIVDPNSALSLDAAAAHELTHYHRWRNKTALPDEAPEELDEAFTSLEAVIRYGRSRQLSGNDILQLVTDALQRLHLYVETLTRPAPPAGPFYPGGGNDPPGDH